MERLSGRIALVTGAARGIGRGIALAFAREGADVAINDLPGGTGLAEVAEEIRGMGRRAWQLPADVSDDQAVRNMVSELLEEAGRVDVLVTNAGVADVMPLTEMTVQSWDR